MIEICIGTAHAVLATPGPVLVWPGFTRDEGCPRTSHLRLPQLHRLYRLRIRREFAGEVCVADSSLLRDGAGFHLPNRGVQALVFPRLGPSVTLEFWTAQGCCCILPIDLSIVSVAVPILG